jgi:hypothetical protein
VTTHAAAGFAPMANPSYHSTPRRRALAHPASHARPRRWRGPVLVGAVPTGGTLTIETRDVTLDQGPATGPV